MHTCTHHHLHHQQRMQRKQSSMQCITIIHACKNRSCIVTIYMRHRFGSSSFTDHKSFCSDNNRSYHCSVYIHVIYLATLFTFLLRTQYPWPTSLLFIAIDLDGGRNVANWLGNARNSVLYMHLLSFYRVSCVFCRFVALRFAYATHAHAPFLIPRIDRTLCFPWRPPFRSQPCIFIHAQLS